MGIPGLDVSSELPKDWKTTTYRLAILVCNLGIVIALLFGDARYLKISIYEEERKAHTATELEATKKDEQILVQLTILNAKMDETIELKKEIADLQKAHHDLEVYVYQQHNK